MGYGCFAILALTYLFIKIRTPKLPANHKVQGFMKVMLIEALAWMVAFIAYTSFMVNGRHTKMEELLIGHIISNLFGNVCIPLYYIKTTPKLCKYVKGFFVKPTSLDVLIIAHTQIMAQINLRPNQINQLLPIEITSSH